jgi:hypothetical protein
MAPPPDAPDDEAVRLELAADDSTVTGLDAANEALSTYGTRTWPIDLTAAPDAIRALLRRPTLTEAETIQVRDHFLLPRAGLLELIASAGRTPSVPGGGEMSTLDVVNDVRYPQLYLVEPGVDYSRFDRLHENSADDGTVLDETMSLLSGGTIRLVQRLPDGSEATLSLRCVGDTTGWLVNYGGLPHIGSFTGAAAGSKILVQAIGPARWQARYVDEPSS